MVTGTAVISGGRVTSAAFRVDLAAIAVNGKTSPQVTSSLHTGQYPGATVTFDDPGRAQLRIRRSGAAGSNSRPSASSS